MWILTDMEAKKLVKTVRDLDAWCHDKRYTDPEDPKFGLLVYAEGIRDGIVRVLKTMGVSVKDAPR